MKKLSFIALSIALLLLSGCSSNSSAQPTASESPVLEAVSENPAPTGSSGGMLDLTKLSSTMVYSEVFNMLASPDSYVGRTVKMTGTAACLANPENSKLYYACIIADATGCCA